MSEKQERFKNLLKELFELDKSDLNFGIYKVINKRKDKVEEFINDIMPKKINEYIEGCVKNDDNKKPELETDVYSSLYDFFNRYYDNGDFISKRRYKKDVYAIPYEGEEVKLYWANQDQYYIKTTENFVDYEFLYNDIRVIFKLVNANIEQNNNKEADDNKREFMLYDKEFSDKDLDTFTYDDKNKTLTIRFVYQYNENSKYKNKRTGKNEAMALDYSDCIQKYLKDNHAELEKILYPVSTEKPIIQKNIERYIAKNEFDYFIHKDLKKFLDRELDFYLKTEVMHLEDLNTENEVEINTYINKIKAIKGVGSIIIDFLASVENFQKKLWLKKKFIIDTNYCMTLDKIPEKYYEIIRKNEAQVNEWIEMYAINEVVGFEKIPTIDFLKNNQNLIVDTKHFDNDFKEQLLEEVDDLDENTNGLLINADNFHAIRILNNKYRNKIDCIYIDPPYNAKSSEIMYKNTFKDSSWLSLINDRIAQTKSLLNKKFTYICAIDEVEQEKLGLLLDQVFLNDNICKTCVTVVHNPSGQQGDNFTTTNEYAYFVYSIPGRSISEQYRENPEEWDQRGLRDVTGDESLRSAAKNCFYPILIKDGKVIGFGDVCSKDFHPNVNEIKEDGSIEIYPIDPKGIERKWRFARDTVETIIDQLIPKYIKNRNIWDIDRLKKFFNYKTVWQDPKYSANNYGTQVLNPMFKFNTFTFPKSIYTVIDSIYAGLNKKKNSIVLDYFAGSGTTANAIIELNKQGDGKNLKFILVEMGKYFNSVTLPRIKKSYYCQFDKWEGGIPIEHNNGVSCIFKYFTQESYEDSLTNISLQNNSLYEALGVNYLNYMLDFESKEGLLNVDKFKHPFCYKMKINVDNEIIEKNIDMIETFNYLIGLKVIKNNKTRYFNIDKVTNELYDGSISIKVCDKSENCIKEIYGILPDGKKTLIIWRNINDELLSNKILDAYYKQYLLHNEYDALYVNGDNTLDSIMSNTEADKTVLIDNIFNKLMFVED